MIDRELIVVAKRPAVGQVKTRLARGIGDLVAFELYRAFLSDIVLRFADGPHAFAVAFAPPDGEFVLPGVRCFAQEGPTLNARLLSIFARQTGRARITLVMSSDSPHVPTDWIARGFERLEDGSVDVVLGPCEDGGYWCVAMREPHDIFSDVTMSTPQVLADTLARAMTLGLRCELLPRTFDVDELADLTRLSNELRDRIDLPATAAILANLDPELVRESLPIRLHEH